MRVVFKVIRVGMRVLGPRVANDPAVVISPYPVLARRSRSRSGDTGLRCVQGKPAGIRRGRRDEDWRPESLLVK
jgi:hypothetical protein